MQTAPLPPAPSVPLLEGLPNSVSIPWYLFFASLNTAVGGGAPTTSLAQLAALFVGQELSLVVPNWLAVTGSPVGGSSGVNGKLTITSARQLPNLVLASPNGAIGFLVPRALVGADLPTPTPATLGGVRSLAPAAHEFLTGISILGQPTQAQPAAIDLSDTIAPTVFTPTDQSGAALVFTSVSVRYAKLGNLVSIYGTLTYPATADATAASISLPVAVPNAAYAAAPGTLLLTGATGAAIQAVVNTSTAAFAGAAGALTNANLSAKVLQFFLTYPAS